MMSEQWRKYPTPLIIGVILAVFLILRFLYLDCDPPLQFKAASRDLITDPYNVTWFARNAVLFGDWDIFDYPRWIVFKYSLSSLAAWLSFFILGVSRISANLSAIFLNLAGLGFFIWGIGKKSRHGGYIAALLLIPNFLLFVYGRYPFLENGLIFIGGLLFYLFCRQSSFRFTPAILGLLCAIAVLMGKLFGFILIFPLGICLLIEKRNDYIKSLGLTLISFLSGLILLAVLFFGTEIQTVYKYLTEQTVGMYGFPESLQSPLRFVEQCLTFGGGSMLVNLQFFLFILGVLSLLILLLRPDIKEFLKNNLPLLFCLIWFLAGYFILALPNHRPLRYQLFLLPPLAGVVAFAFSSKFDMSEVRFPGWIRSLAILAVLWYFAEQAIMTYYREIDYQDAGLAFKMIWVAFPLALILSAAALYFRRAFLKIVFYRNIILIVLTVLFIGNQSLMIFDWFTNRSYTLKETNRDVAECLGERALLIGPFASALTIDNQFPAFIYMFGLAEKEPDLFRRYPFTHLAVDPSNWDEAFASYGQLAGSEEIFQQILAYSRVSLVRLNRGLLQGNYSSYVKTDYELAADYFGARRLDSGMIYLERFLEKYPRNKPGLYLKAEYFLLGKQLEPCENTVNKLTDLYFRDFSVLYKAGYLYYRMYRYSGLEKYRLKADSLFAAAASRYPELKEQVITLKSKIDQGQE